MYVREYSHVHLLCDVVELFDHSFLAVSVHNEHSHLRSEQLSGVANVDGCLLLVSSQHPDLDVSL